MKQTDDIKSILTEQVGGYRILLDLLQRERATLLRFDPRAMESLSKEKDTIVMKLRLLEEERIRLVQAFMEEHRITDKAVLSKLAEVVGNDSFQRLRLQLISLLQSITELNGFNRVLIERSTAVVKNTLNFLSSIGVAMQTNNSGTLFSREA